MDGKTEIIQDFIDPFFPEKNEKKPIPIDLSSQNEKLQFVSNLPRCVRVGHRIPDFVGNDAGECEARNTDRPRASRPDTSSEIDGHPD
jgi:hypothetical protein